MTSLKNPMPKLKKWANPKNVAKSVSTGGLSDVFGGNKQAEGLLKTATDPLGLGLGDALFGKSKGPDYSQYDEEQAAAMAAQQAAYDEFINGGAAQYSQGEKLNYEELFPEELAQLGPSAYQDINTDPRLVNAEMDALRSLEERSKEGLTLQDEADMARLQGDFNRRNKGRMGAIQQNMQSRGMSGSGMDMVAQMQANQDATEMEALAGLEKAAQAQNNKRAASVDAGKMASSQRGQQFQESAQKAAARDAIERFNTGNRVDQQRSNNAGRNAANSANWDRTNSVADKNVSSQADFRKDKLQAGLGKSGAAYNWSADQQNRKMMQDAQEKQGMSDKIGNIFGAAGGVVGGIYGGPAGAQAGYQGGKAVGGAAGNTYYDNGGRGYAHGGMVHGDDEANDRVPIMASEGEVVIPRSISDDPVKSSEFVAEANGEELDAVGHLLAAMQMMNRKR